MELELLLKDINEKSETFINMNGLRNRMDGSSLEYINYINEHRENVGKAYYLLYPVIKNYLFDPMFFRMDIIQHDLTKYSQAEFEGYRQKYYPSFGETVDEAKAEKAWKHHYTANQHHPEFYKDSALEMPIYRMLEMIIDWTAMSIKFKDSPYNYYIKNKRQKFIDEYKGIINVDLLDSIFEKLQPLLKEVFPDSHKDK